MDRETLQAVREITDCLKILGERIDTQKQRTDIQSDRLDIALKRIECLESD